MKSTFVVEWDPMSLFFRKGVYEASELVQAVASSCVPAVVDVLNERLHAPWRAVGDPDNEKRLVWFMREEEVVGFEHLPQEIERLVRAAVEDFVRQHDDEIHEV